MDSELPLSLKVLGVDMKPCTVFKMLFMFMLAIHPSGDGVVYLYALLGRRFVLSKVTGFGSHAAEQLSASFHLV